MLALVYTISILSMIVLPVLLAGLLRRRMNAPWLWFSIGMLTFAASQFVHFPLNEWLSDMGWLKQPGSASQPLWLTALILGLTAGICEELARAAGYVLVKRARSLPDGLMLGLGHGGIESMVFGGVQVAAMLGSLLPIIHQGLESIDLTNATPDQIAALQTQLNMITSTPFLGFLSLVERLFAIGIHVTLSVMVLRAFQRRNPLWVIFAVGYHLLIDAVAVSSAVLSSNYLVSEAIFFLIALPGYIWLARVIRRELPALTARPNPLRREWTLFLTALRKELLQLWRTKRVLITAAVFGLFGLTSPLVAYFKPELMKAIPGAEAFASLIPTPTTGDAMLQYHKNITQFLFLLAVIFGMGSVASEKEHGAATLILSKPLPRWAYLSSKLASQGLLFAFGFLLSAIGGYFYTVILFGQLGLADFIRMNFLLFVWILPFTSLTLVGSVLGATTTAAGGISLALVVGFMLVSGIPLISGLMPNALSQWAEQLGTLAAGIAASSPGSIPLPDGPIPGNYAALATTLVAVLVCLVAAFGLFESQEL